MSKFVDRRPRFKELLNKFIQRPRFRMQPGFYHPMGAVVLCKLSYGPILPKPKVFVFRSRRGIHAEARLLRYLRKHKLADASSVVNIEIFQNLSPCNDSVGQNESCVQSLVSYKNDVESQGKTINIEISFANFFRVVRYQGNPRQRADQNCEGLKLLRKHGIKLKMLTGKDEWERLLYDDQLVALDDGDKEFCLKVAMSSKGVKRELYDKRMFDLILEIAANRLTYDDVINHFIAPKSDSVVLACEVSYPQNKSQYSPEFLVLRGGNQCAENKLLRYLDVQLKYKKVDAIEIRVIQNVYPCSKDCLSGIISYKHRLEKEGKAMLFSFKFGNRSTNQTDTYTHDAKTQLSQEEIEVKELMEPQSWKEFLRNDRVVDLNGQQIVFNTKSNIESMIFVVKEKGNSRILDRK